jgi:hypothetical protein
VTDDKRVLRVDSFYHPEDQKDGWFTSEMMERIVESRRCPTCRSPAFMIVNFSALDHSKAKEEGGMVELDVPNHALLTVDGFCDCPDTEKEILVANNKLFRRLELDVLLAKDAETFLRMILDEGHTRRK